ncbi:MAG: extracellular solute-binding protein [Bdellovibrionales bacterium]
MTNTLAMAILPLCKLMPLLFAALLSIGTLIPQAQAAEPRASLAMHGEPKYAENFTHYDYANPDAPKAGTLRLAATGTYDSLNPFVVRGQAALGLDTGYLSLIYEPLMTRSADEPFSLYGLLAQSIEVPDDRSWIVFHLDPRATWSDGKPITADDVIFSFKTLRDSGRPNHRTYYKKVAKAEKEGPRSVRFEFSQVCDRPVQMTIAPPAALARHACRFDTEMPMIMALMPILPERDWQGLDFSRPSLRVPVGSGPYRIEKVEPGRSISYARREDYWGRNLAVERGLHNFDRITIDYYRDNSIALQAFKAGQYDYKPEMNPNVWATAYDFPAVKDGRVTLLDVPHRRVQPMTGFAFNTRRQLFKAHALREAMALAFDSGWIAKNLYYGAVRRTTSFFPNSELEAPPLPEGREKEILERFPSIPKKIFERPITAPDTDGSEASLRENLIKASAILRAAGYEMRNDKLFAPNKTDPLSFEILLRDPADEKIALTWARSLARLGITALVHTVDSAQYVARLAQFNYDVIIAKWTNTASPGNEQIFFWGSAAAKQPGSRNYPGIEDPVIDALASAVPMAETREDLVATAHALDRMLMSGRYVIPFFYQPEDHLAYWNTLQHPDSSPPYGMVLETWWKKPD